MKTPIYILFVVSLIGASAVAENAPDAQFAIKDEMVTKDNQKYLTMVVTGMPFSKKPHITMDAQKIVVYARENDANFQKLQVRLRTKSVVNVTAQQCREDKQRSVCLSKGTNFQVDGAFELTNAQVEVDKDSATITIPVRERQKKEKERDRMVRYVVYNQSSPFSLIDEFFANF
jgi:hypothetical protein